MVDVAIPSMRATMIPGSPTSEVLREATKPMVVLPPDAASSSNGSLMQDADPTVATLMRAVDHMGALAASIGGAIDKQPGGPRGAMALLVLLSIGSGLFFGVLGAVGAIWMHDADTRGRLSTALGEQDKAIKAVGDAVAAQGQMAKDQAKDQSDLVVVVEGLLDEHEAMSEWLPRALEAGFSKEPIPRMGSSVTKLRRKMPAQ